MAGAPQQQGGGGGGDSSNGALWIMAALMIGTVALWYFAHTEIVRFVFWIDQLEAQLVLTFIDIPDLRHALYILQTIDAAQVDWQNVVSITGFVGGFLIYPIVIIFCSLAAWLYIADISLRFHKTYDMKLLREQEHLNWAAITPVLKENLVVVDVDEGSWAMALLPMQFAKKYHLLKKEDEVMDKALPGMEMTAGLRRGDAKRIFTLQLGAYWEGGDKCPAHVIALAAIFMARIHRDRAAAKLILDTLNKTFGNGKISYQVAKPIFKKYEQTDAVQQIIQYHGYVLTVMAALLEEARKDGVLASAEFLWLKLIDRRLWYMLNSVGRQTGFCEVGGPFAHWLAEKTMKRPSRVPMVDEAVKGLEIAIKEIKLTPQQMQELKP